MSSLAVLCWSLSGLIGVFAADLCGQPPHTSHEIIRGRVTAETGAQISHAMVIATRLSDRQFKSAESDANGQYSIDWPDGDGQYVVFASATGFAPASRRASRTGSDSVMVIDVKLSALSAAHSLAAVIVTAPRSDRDRNTGHDSDPAATDRTTFSQNAARRLSPDQAGDLAAIAALATGVMPVQGGISVLGLGASQNAVTLNGLAFSGADVPRDAATRVRVTTSSYDPSIGWFSGARTQVDLLPGDLFTTRSAHFTGDAPALQWTDPVSARLGQRFASFNASAGGTGQLVQDKWSYNYGLQGGSKTADVASLTTAGADLLSHVGVSNDSALELIHLMEAAGIPVQAGGVGATQSDDDVSFIGRIDHAPYDWSSLQSAKTTWGLTAYTKWKRTRGLGLGPTSTAGHGGASSLAMGSLQGEWSTYFGPDYLADVRSSVTRVINTTSPYLNLPAASVLVVSSIPGTTGGASNLQFGGNSALRTSSSTVTWESIGDVDLFSPGPATHRVRLTGDIRFDDVTQRAGINSLGTYTFNSLGEFAADQPASFSRTIDSPVRRGDAWNGFVALGDVWRTTPNLLLNYGVRGEANVFARTPPGNPAVASVFGVRTDHAPNTIGLSPRLGFVYNVPGAGARPVGSLHGGAGIFRNLIDPSLLAGPSVSTGLPAGAGQLTCLGGAVPTPNWIAFAADPSNIPRQCLNGTGPSFSDASPAVTIMAPDFAAAESRRANIGWSATALRSAYALNFTLSDNVHQRGTRDLNFRGVEGFVTSDEGRPVFATPGGIVPSTGAVSAADARRFNSFASVNEGVTDLRSRSQQLTVDVRPYLGSRLSPYLADFVVGYTLAGIRDKERGFDQATFGDPSTLDWARGALDARHQVVVQGVIHLRPGVFVFVAGRAQSGTPYTPMIRTDVNGDGLANDRAFVFDPARSPDPLIGNGMRELLLTTSKGARSCLMRQLGVPAARSSCEGPWSASMSASLRLSGQQVFHQPRMDLTLGLSNPLGGLDQLLHGADKLHGWGTHAAPDPVLLDVRGFDPSAKRYLYSVNPRFGSTSSSSSTARAPFRLTLDVSLDLAAAQTKQQMERWLGPSRGGGARVTLDDLVRRFQRTVPDPYLELIGQSDSLLLTQPQVEALGQADRRYRVRVDSVWSTLSRYLISIQDEQELMRAYPVTDQATDDAWEITRVALRRELPEILTTDQLTLLPQSIKYLFNATSRVHIRMYPRGG